jgi:hypothetical protein
VGAVVLTALLLAVGFGVMAEGDSSLLTRAKTVVCRYNQRLIEQAYELFSLQQGRPAQDLAELLDTRFVRRPRCLAGGSYRLTPDGEVRCTVHDRLSPRITTLGVYRAAPRDPEGETPVFAFRLASDPRAVFFARWAADGLEHHAEVRWLEADGRVLAVTRALCRKPEVASHLRLGNAAGGPPRIHSPGEYRVALLLDGEPAGDCTFWVTD